MARPPLVKSIPHAIISNGRTFATMVREGQAGLRRTAEVLKQMEPANPEEKALLDEYLSDPLVNPGAEKKAEAPTEAKPVSERDKFLTRFMRQLQDAEMGDLEMLQNVWKATKRTPSPKAGNEKAVA